MQQQRAAYLYAYTAVLIWSTIAAALSMTLRYLSQTELLFWSILSSWTILGAMLLYSGRGREALSYLRRHWQRTLLLGTLNPFLYYLTLFEAYRLLPAQEAQAINYTWALMLTYLSVPLLGHSVRKRDIAAGILCYLGVLLIATHGALNTLEFSNPKGVFVALLSTVLWALYWIVLTRYKEDTMVLLYGNFTVGLLWIALYFLLSGQRLSLPSSVGHLGALYIGLFEMGITFVLWGKALKLTSKVSSISNLIFLSPLLSLFFIRLFAGEPIYTSTLYALALILAGLYLQQRQYKEG